MGSSAQHVGKIVILSEYIHEAENSTGYFWSKIIERLANGREKLTVIAPASFVPGCDMNTIPGVEYHYFKRSKFNKNGLLTRLFGQLEQALKFTRFLVKYAEKGDLLVTGTNPMLLLLVLPIIRRILRFQWVLLVHDVYPDNLVPSKILNPRSMIFKLLSRYFDWVYRSADLVFVIGRDMQKLIESKIGKADKVHYIPNWVDENDIEPSNRSASEIIKSLNWEDKIVFQFFGNFGRVQGIDNLLDGIKLVKNPLAKFLFIGGGVKVDLVKEFAANQSSQKAVYFGELAQSKKMMGLVACDVALITLEKGMLGLGVPSKAYFSMAADRPLMAVMESDAEIALMVKEHNIGWVCEPGNPALLAALIDEICATTASKRLANSRVVFEKYYSERVGLDQFVRTLLKFSNRLPK
jgi:glycosyltransferase involved in cell wall biosynthesis